MTNSEAIERLQDIKKDVLLPFNPITLQAIDFAINVLEETAHKSIEADTNSETHKISQERIEKAKKKLTTFYYTLSGDEQAAFDCGRVFNQILNLKYNSCTASAVTAIVGIKKSFEKIFDSINENGRKAFQIGEICNILSGDDSDDKQSQ